MIARVPMPRSADAGFTLIETLVATTLMLAVTSAVFALSTPGTVLSRSTPEAADLQQRARAAADAIMRDLHAAGAGIDVGPDAGSLGNFIPSVVPRRLGRGADAFTIARADAITITWADAGWTHAMTSAPIASTSPALNINSLPGCPIADAWCGLAEGMDALVFDAQANFDFFRVGNIAGSTAELRHHDAGPGYAYAVGAHVVAATTHVYYLDAATHQLRMTDGYLSDTPVVDEVASLSFAYFGDPNPPVAPMPPMGTANCLHDVDGHAAAGLAVLSSAGGSLAPLPLSMLNDGPWCGANNTRFDADLLRVRRVQVTIGVQASRPDPRVPDYVLTFDVSPQNLAVVR